MILYLKHKRKMKYKVVKGRNAAMPSAGKYVARAVHAQTIEWRELAQEGEHSTAGSVSDFNQVATELTRLVEKHLKAGDRVRLADGTILKLEVESRPALTEEEFGVANIKGVRLHILPGSSKGVQSLYKDIQYEKLK